MAEAHTSAEDLDNLAAIWILASNDDQPEISYRGLVHRLGLDVATVQRVVAAHTELFRLTIGKSRLQELQSQYQAGKALPAWLKAISELERGAAIGRLTVDDFFRSQFRSGAGAARSPIEIVEWGLRHVDRMRTSLLDVREAPLRRFATVWIPLLSTVVAFLAVASSMYFQYESSSEQRALKQYEVEFKPKIDGYVRLMQAVTDAFESAVRGGDDSLQRKLRDLELSAIQLEPFLPEASRQSMNDDVQKFIAFCLDTRRPEQTSPEVSGQAINRFVADRRHLRDTLFDALFH